MAPDEPAGTRPAPVVLRIKLRYDDVEAMTERFAPHVGRSGLFLPTRSMQPIGTEVKFELRLATEQPVLVGLGRVQSVKEPDPADPGAVYGLGVELMRVTRESRELILKLLARRRQLGLPEVALPRAEEIEAARRHAEGAVPQPIGGSPSAPLEAAQSPELLTAPRRTTGPVAVPKAISIAPLPEEPPRRKRRAVSEVIESASGPIAASMLVIPGLDEEVDVAGAIARARALATGDLDRELELLRDQTAAPLVEISIDAASAELARQLGGAAVRKDRSQGWAPPPAVATEGEARVEASEAATAVVASLQPVVVEPEPEPEPVAAEPEPVAATPEPEPVAATPEPEPVAAEPEPVAAEPEPEPIDPEHGIERDDEDLAHLHTQIRPYSFTPPSAEPIISEPPAPPAGTWTYTPPHDLQPDPGLEDFEHTQIGGRPMDPGTLDEPLAAAEPEAGVHDVPAAHHAPYGSGLDGSIVTSPTYTEVANPADYQPYGAGIESLVVTRPAHTELAELAAAAAPGSDDDDAEMEIIEEIDEFEILAEADADDADLLAAYGEAELAATPEVPLPGAHAAGEPDFASRLDLGDDSDFYAPAPASGYYDPHGAAAAPLTLEGTDEPVDFDEPHAHAAPRAAYARYESQSGYVTAQPPRDPADEFSSHHVGFSTPHEFDQSDVIAVPPELQRDRPSEPSLMRTPPTDLESALEGLDVNLDELAAPPAPAPVPRAGSGRVVRPAATTPSGRTPRLQSEPGILITFDDDDEDEDR